MKAGNGILMWDSFERRTNRYGFFYLDSTNYGCSVRVDVKFDLPGVNALVGKKVKITAVVVRARKSGHVGDLFLGITPTKPTIGESIVIGIGTLDVGTSHNGLPMVGLRPADGRDDLWIDPRKLYRLHDQTVNLFIEETDEPEEPKAEFNAKEDGAITNGDGTFQVKRTGKNPVRMTVLPDFVNVGDGTFIVGYPDGTMGQRLNARFVD